VCRRAPLARYLPLPFARAITPRAGEGTRNAMAPLPSCVRYRPVGELLSCLSRSPDRHGTPWCYYLPRRLCTLHSREAPRHRLVLRVPFASRLHRSRALLLLLLRSTPWLCLLLRPCRWTLPNVKLAASFLLVPCRVGSPAQGLKGEQLVRCGWCDVVFLPSVGAEKISFVSRRRCEQRPYLCMRDVRVCVPVLYACY